MKPLVRPGTYRVFSDPDDIKVSETHSIEEALREYNRLAEETEAAVFLGGMILRGDEWIWGVDRP